MNGEDAVKESDHAEPIPQRVADVLADKAFMRRVLASAEDSRRGVKGTPFRDIQRKNRGV